MTKLSITQLTQVTGHIKGEGMSVTADKPKAIARLQKVVGETFGDEGLTKLLLECESAVEACKKVDELKRKGMVPEPKKEEQTMNDTNTIEAPKTEPKPEAKKRGRTASNNGRTITAIVETNPRREGTHGHKSMEIVLKAGKNGIKYEDYIAAGGRPNDLAWDLDHKSVKIV